MTGILIKKRHLDLVTDTHTGMMPYEKKDRGIYSPRNAKDCQQVTRNLERYIE